MCVRLLQLRAREKKNVPEENKWRSFQCLEQILQWFIYDVNIPIEREVLIAKKARKKICFIRAFKKQISGMWPSDDQHGEEWIQCVSCNMWPHTEYAKAEKLVYICDFCKE